MIGAAIVICDQCGEQGKVEEVPIANFVAIGLPKKWIEWGPGGAELHYCSNECMLAAIANEPTYKQLEAQDK